jgi:hypothetical protein
MEQPAANAMSNLKQTSPIERRSAERFALLIRAGKLILPNGEFLCIVRDVSETGLKAKTFHSIQGLSRCLIELPNGLRFAIEKVWQEGAMIGFGFCDPVRIEHIMADNVRPYIKRPLRLNWDHEARLITNRGRLNVRISDISQQGAGISSSEWLAIDEQVRLEIPHMPAIHGKVRWRKKPRYGLIFEDTFSFSQLAHLTAPAGAEFF